MRPNRSASPCASSDAVPALLCQYAGDLPGGLGGAKPVKRLADQHGVNGLVTERDRFGGAIQRHDVGHLGGECVAHPRGGLDGDHLTDVRAHQARELTGPGGQIEHRRCLAKAERVDDHRDRLRRVAWPAALVGVGGRGKPRGARGSTLTCRASPR